MQTIDILQFSIEWTMTIVESYNYKMCEYSLLFVIEVFINKLTNNMLCYCLAKVDIKNLTFYQFTTKEKNMKLYVYLG